ncbi:MAG TPA: EAL domain-containing protein, partial [Gammaproteobacteria bacterium]|nr:EAL domain-containing protein [Gammaproteobacteria bacterium]
AIWGALYASVKAGKGGTIPSTNRRKDGTIFPVEVTPTNMTFGDQEFGCSVNLDVSASVAAENALRESEEKFRVIAETSPVALIIHRAADGAILFANRAAEILFNRAGDAMVGNPIITLIESEESRQLYSDVMTGKEMAQGRELMLYSKDGKTRWASLSASAITLNDEQAVCCVLQDVTEAHDLSLQLSYQAAYDPLTGLVNRREFENRLSRFIKSAGVNGVEHAMCFLDLDQFKVINDTCGHIAGDELLRQLGQILKSHIRKIDTLARLGGDEFAVLLLNCSISEGRRVADAIREAVQQYRFLWENNSFSVGVSIGLVPIDQPDEDLTEIMRRADTACYQAKENGRNRIYVYHADDVEMAQRHGEMQWVSRIAAALEQNRFQIWAQKIISIRNPKARRMHYELLVRMVDEAGHIVPPDAFLPAAERYNLISRIDRWVIDHTLHWFSRHPDEYRKLKMCAINLSGQSLSNEDLCRDIIELFQRYQLAAGRFCFEITETAAIANLNAATHFMKDLRKLGCRFALDDFGSGLSSFAYLKNIPVDFIKIDGLFIKDLETDLMHLALVKSINEVCHVMGKETIAEFVENAQILDKLRTLGVDYAQGYGIAKPELMIEGSDIVISRRSAG